MTPDMSVEPRTAGAIHAHVIILHDGGS
eukprot:SAG31_NODE_41739_length_272_cov_1.622857_1_plen_27_part_01